MPPNLIVVNFPSKFGSVKPARADPKQQAVIPALSIARAVVTPYRKLTEKPIAPRIISQRQATGKPPSTSL